MLRTETGPLTYLLGSEIPENATRKTDGAGKALKLAEAIWKSPVFLVPGATEPSRLHVHIRFPVTVLGSACAAWNALYRLREQLLMNLIASMSTYIARPGIVALPVK